MTGRSRPRHRTVPVPAGVRPRTAVDRRQRRGQIFIEAGLMAMASVGLGRAHADGGRSVREHWPPTGSCSSSRPTALSHRAGDLSYPPGYKENAGVFCHTTVADDREASRERRRGAGLLPADQPVGPRRSRRASLRAYDTAQMIAGATRRPTAGENSGSRGQRRGTWWRSASGSSASDQSTTACGWEPVIPAHGRDSGPRAVPGRPTTSGVRAPPTAGDDGRGRGDLSWTAPSEDLSLSPVPGRRVRVEVRLAARPCAPAPHGADR
jgi:hypothetical protein